MLFLAVFCGFLAENQREHMIEHRREKQFMKSLLSDITEDTTELNKSIYHVSLTNIYQDSILLYIHNRPQDYVSKKFLDTFSFFGLSRLSIVFNEVTASQLKNAGNLRLIRNQSTIRKIALYWKEEENTIINLDRYLLYRNRGREIEEKLFAFSDNDLVEAGLITRLPYGARIIQPDPVLWFEYANIISHCKITTRQYIGQLKKQLGLSKELISLLKKEYHLK